MLRISRLTDYGTVILAHLASQEQALRSASDVAEATGIGQPTVSKLLKSLTRAGILRSVRGANGGYGLALSASQISAAQVIDALEGPVSITECSLQDHHCCIAEQCTVGNGWKKINLAIRKALQDISLDDLLQSSRLTPRFEFAGTPITVERRD